MKDTNNAIYEILVDDLTLVNLLGSNAPYQNPNGTASKANSIVPHDMAHRKLATPFITIQEGNENKLGGVYSQSFFIRCYNGIEKSYIEINTILDRVRFLLDDSEMDLSDRRHVKTDFESRLPGLKEEGMNLKFKEERYRVTVL